MSTTASDRIVLTEVSKFYGEVLGVNRVDLRIPPGITSLVGPNGSGKTTLINCISGFLKPTGGSILFRGREMVHKDVALRVVMHVYELLEDIAKIEREPHMEGRRMIMLLTKK